MKNMKSLIDSASEICGGDSALAKRMGVAQSVISDLRHDRRTITPETAAELADIAGVDALQAMADAVIARNKGTRREGVLREILGKALVAGVAGVLVFSYSSDSISATASKTNNAGSFTEIHIVEHGGSIFRLLFAGLRRLARRVTMGCSPYPQQPAYQ